MREPLSDSNGILTDSIGRRMDYLRVSLTDKCNLNCVYCRALENGYSTGAIAVQESHLKRMLKAFAMLGVRKIRFTGGEPLLNRSLMDLVSYTASLPGVETVALTTNGTLLQRKLEGLVEAGLNRLNISLDSLQRDTFRSIAGVDMLDRVVSVVDKACAIEVLGRIKINTVVIRGINDSEIPDFVEWALPKNLDLRFIEFMPTRFTGWGRERLVTEREMQIRIGYRLNAVERRTNPSATSRLYRVGTNPGRIGFISSISGSFCNTCNRLRLTADGKLFGCLFRSNFIDLSSEQTYGWHSEQLAGFIRDRVAMPDFKRDPGIKGELFKPSMVTVGG